MRVALLSGNAPLHNAVGNQIAEKVRFFRERGAEVRLFLQDARQLHPDLRSCTVEVPEPTADGPAWDFISQADLVIAVYAQHYSLLQYLPRLVGVGPRIVFEYLGVTPPELWNAPNREGLEQSQRQRGYVWCADHALTASQASRQELRDATHFPAAHVSTLPLVVDTERFTPMGQTPWISADGPILLYVGRLAGNKRVPMLIEALAHLDSAHAVIVGDDNDVYAEEAARCRTLAQQLGVADRVHFLGQLDDAELARAYRSADVFVMPSLHEGFCIPVIEAMACGLPVVASRSAALPETVGDAGLTFVPNDVADLVRQLRRVLADPAAVLPSPHRGRGVGGEGALGPRRIAVVSFRFGPDIVGGAETSLLTMAKALHSAGHHVEVFTTCTKSESDWRNELPAGTLKLDRLTVHRFPIDAHDHAAHGETVRAILEADGNVPPENERCYLRQSIHSSALIAALRNADFDAVITGPYLFGLTADIAREFPQKTLVVPCFHHEPLARLAAWPPHYGNVGGLLFHSIEEQELAQQRLGINHPNSSQIGTYVASGTKPTPANFPRPYVVYCGRFSGQKNVPLLLDWATRYQAERPGCLDFVFVGQGEIQRPNLAWLHDLGYVDEATKRSVLAGAKALVQLSTQESLSLAALEAWAVGTPVIAHRDCPVLAGQIERSRGGLAIADHTAFASALDELWQSPAIWQERGENGRTYVNTNYSCANKYVDRLTAAIDRIRMPLREQMRERGLRRAEKFSRARWQKRFAELVEQWLTQPARPCRESLTIKPLRTVCEAAASARTFLLPVRLANHGTHAVVPDGPGRTVVHCEIQDDAGQQVVVDRSEIRLPAMLIPGQATVAALPIALPTAVGSYRILLWMEPLKPRDEVLRIPGIAPVEIALTIGVERTAKGTSCASAFLDTVQETLPRTHELQQLPTEYVDVTEGRLAPVKRLIKRKLLHNFKHAYVDVLSRQQSEFNGQVVLMIQQLMECCAMLDHAVAGLHDRLDKLEAMLEFAPSEPEALAK